MTSIRESIRRLLGETADQQADQPRPYYSYRIYWTKMVREWPIEKRKEVVGKLAQVLGADDFEPNTLERRFSVDGLDSGKHAGASLLALREVLQAFDKFEQDHKEDSNE